MHMDLGMKRIAALAAALALVVGSAAGCMVTRHGHVAFVPPPALVVAGAIAATAAMTRPGYVWVDGHWDWVGDRWAWTDGEWIAERPGFFWVQGAWIVDGGRRWAYRPGHWAPHGTVIRDHRR